MTIKKRFLLIVPVILAFAVAATMLSTFYTQSGYVGFRDFRVSYGFPVGWHGYSITVGVLLFPTSPNEVPWFSLQAFLLDIAFWLVVCSFIAWWVVVKT